MAKLDYEDESKALSKAIDIAIEAVKKFPPNGFDNKQLNHFVNTYLQFKDNILNPELKHKNSKSLSYIKNDVLTYFQEGTGNAIHYFWKLVNEQDLGFKRENKLTKILKRQQIKNQLEYDFIIDVLVPYQQEGVITETDVKKLNEMISEFEKKP